ncbi:hypothetical protein C5167_040302 [Papaver somniferum]|uniref:Plant heme peroxidase family profile domain-containing protein n=1 Tax=Papaver somniferum TaxID=3469 RepID=A0A4Y7IEL9_PAPSO|nr:hypothetical protein C5167_040302 [Papaver somniferum]
MNLLLLPPLFDYSSMVASIRDVSVLLNSTNGVKPEKVVLPNELLKGFDVVDMINRSVESVCHGVVSCSDIPVIAARFTTNSLATG